MTLDAQDVPRSAPPARPADAADAAGVIDAYLRGLESTLAAVSRADVARAAQVIAAACRAGGRIYVCGNGGSAATASHMACDLAKQAAVPGRPRPRAFALTDNVPLLTAWSNDADYAEAFARQLDGLLEAGDVVVAISCSGRSANVLAAVDAARAAGARTIGLVGAHDSPLAEGVDCAIGVPSDDIGHREDVHLAVNHALTQAVRRLLASGPRDAMGSGS